MYFPNNVCCNFVSIQRAIQTTTLKQLAAELLGFCWIQIKWQFTWESERLNWTTHYPCFSFDDGCFLLSFAMSVGLVSHDLWICPLELPEAKFSHASPSWWSPNKKLPSSTLPSTYLSAPQVLYTSTWHYDGKILELLTNNRVRLKPKLTCCFLRYY